MDPSGDAEYVGSVHPGAWPDPPDWVDGAPTGGIGQSCAFCGTRDVAWVHPLDRDLRAYRAAGKEHTLPRFWTLCEACETAYVSGDDDAAVEVMRAHRSDEEIAVDPRRLLAVFRRADRGSRRLDPEPPALVEAREHAFRPLRELTGAPDTLGRLWPAEHRRWLDDLGPDPGEHIPGSVPERWLVRSPWPSLSVEQTLHVLWWWVERPPFPSEDETWAARVREVLGWSESKALNALRLLDSES